MRIYLIGYMRKFGRVSRLFAIQEPADGGKYSRFTSRFLSVKPVKIDASAS